MYPYAENVIPVRFLQFDIADSLGVGTAADGMFVVVDKFVSGDAHLGQRIEEGVDRPVAPAHHVQVFPVHRNNAGKDGGVVIVCGRLFQIHEVPFNQFIFPFQFNEFFVEQIHDLVFVQLVAVSICRCFHDIAEFRLHGLGQTVAPGLLQHESRAALAGLAVDADNGFVLAVNIRRVNGQIGNLPVFRPRVFHIVEAFFDGVLVGTGERGKSQLPRVGLPGRNFHLSAFLVHFAHRQNIVEVQFRVHALGVHVQGHRDDVQIAGPLPVAEKAAFDPFSPGQKAQFGAGHAGAPVVMGMEADDGSFPVGQVFDKILDLVRVGIGRAHFHRSRQVENDRIFFGSTQCFHNLVADPDSKILLRSRIAFRGIFVTDVHAAAGHFLLRQLPDQFGAFHGNIHNAVHILPEYDLPLQCGGGIIKMNDYVFRALHRFEGFMDQLRPCLYQHLQDHVVRHQVLLDKGADDFVFGFRSGRETDFDFLEANIY